MDHAFGHATVVLQARLRAQFIQELRTRGQLPVESSGRRVVTLSDRLLHSVVAEHLKSYGFEATLSVFMPECGCVTGSAAPSPVLAVTAACVCDCRSLGSDALSREDILHVWTTQVKDTALFERWDPATSLLHGLVQSLCSHASHSNAMVQCDPLPDPTLGESAVVGKTGMRVLLHAPTGDALCWERSCKLCLCLIACVPRSVPH